MTLTDAAAERVKQLMAKADKPIVGLRVGVKAQGCSGMSYFVEYAEEKKKFEEVVEDKGVTLLIDPAATKLQSGFTFSNPNEKGRCGCGESFHI